MIITFENIIEIDDILFNISKYLPFEYKIIFGKICNKNLIKFYDFNSDNYTYKKLYDLMEPDDEYIMDIKYYIDYHKILEKYIQKNKKIYLESNKLDYVDFQEKTNDEIYSLPINEFLNLIEYYRRYNRYRNIFDEDLEDILFRSIYGIYVRIMIEYIEYNDIIYSKDIQNEIDISENIENYYISVIENDIDMDLFCSRCGLFGHDNISELCILFNEKFRDKEINKNITYIVNDLVTKICKNYQEEIIEEKCKINMCNGKNCNNIKSFKCLSNMCKNCCKSSECSYHYNKNIIKNEQILLKCKAKRCKALRSSKCLSNMCKNCCKSSECSYHKDK